jgi:hypothetical protein
MRINRILTLFSLFLITSTLSAQMKGIKNADTTTVAFNQYFTARVLRVDYLLAGDKNSEVAFLDQIKQEPYWGGSREKLIDIFNMGSYRYLLTDSASGKLLFSRGFSTLFQEWRGTPEATILKRAYSQSAIMPYPKKTVRFALEKRSFANGEFVQMMEIYINPADYMINREKPLPVTYLKFKDSGDPSKKVDIAFIAEGYTEAEMSKFLTDAQKIGDYFLTVSPFSENRNKFNFYALLSASNETGVDVPGRGKYSKTSVNSNFYTFGMDRYLTTSDTKSVYDIAANVPYDAVFILVNSDIYGGGGFFNHLAVVTVDNPFAKVVAVHEFGHSFAGLADEYTGDVSYTDTYNLKVEPWEPNITTNVDFASKWKSMISTGTPLPTPRTEEYATSVGMFEGGGYVTEGIYSPYQDCRMKTNESTGFCPVCQRAIRRMIQFHCE